MKKIKSDNKFHHRRGVDSTNNAKKIPQVPPRTVRTATRKEKKTEPGALNTMPPSAAATGDDEEDHALPSSNPSFAQISGSDMDIDNGDDEEEEDPEEEVGGGDDDDDDDDEEIEEKEEVEEEEVDQRRNG